MPCTYCWLHVEMTAERRRFMEKMNEVRQGMLDLLPSSRYFPLKWMSHENLFFVCLLWLPEKRGGKRRKGWKEEHGILFLSQKHNSFTDHYPEKRITIMNLVCLYIHPKLCICCLKFVLQFHCLVSCKAINFLWSWRDGFCFYHPFPWLPLSLWVSPCFRGRQFNWIVVSTPFDTLLFLSTDHISHLDHFSCFNGFCWSFLFSFFSLIPSSSLFIRRHNKIRHRIVRVVTKYSTGSQ